TAAHVAAETAAHPGPGQQNAPADSGPAAGTAAAARKPFRVVFLDTSWRNLSLRGASQAGLVNNLNDGLTWGVFPLLFASRGLARGLGVSEFGRDLGYAAGAVIAGLVAGACGLSAAVVAGGVLALVSGLLAARWIVGSHSRQHTSDAGRD